jgi:hypothetical protein
MTQFMKVTESAKTFFSVSFFAEKSLALSQQIDVASLLIQI